MNMQLTNHTNAKLLQHFPTDPYADVMIRSILGQYQLQIAFLWIESEFFQELYTHNIREVDLKHLPEPYLESVLKSLYGDSLVVESFSDLAKYYVVVQYLRIGEYVKRIVESLRSEMRNVNPIQLLQFCYSNGILLNEVKQMFIQDNLQVLQDKKYYLQLNKIQPAVFLRLLNEYLRESACPTKQSIIDSVLDSYFSRNKIQPQAFFTNYKEDELSGIWEQRHQQTFYDKMLLQTQATESDEMKKTTLISTAATFKFQEKVKELQAEVEIQAKKIKQLEELNASYKQSIMMLQAENAQLRRHQQPSFKIKSPAKLVRFVDALERSAESSKKSDFVMVQSYMPNSSSGKKLEKSDVTCLCGEAPNDDEFEVDDADLAVVQTPLPIKSLALPQQTKTLNQLKQRNKKIFG